MPKERWFGRLRLLNVYIFWNNDFFDPLSNFDELRSLCFGVDFYLTSLCPAICFVTVPYKAEQQAGTRSMHDEPNVIVDSNRPEVLVFGLIKLVKAHSWVGGVQLEVEGSGFHSLLLVACQFGEAVGKGVGNTKVHKR